MSDEYDSDSPAAWDARVARGARYLDEALLTHEWRNALRAKNFEEGALDYGVDILDQLCGLGFTPVCRDAVAFWVMQTYRHDMLTAGFDYAGTDEFVQLHRAWARFLAADAALQVTA